MTDKIVVLFMTDWADSGFGTVGKELCARLAEMELFDIHYLGWHSQPNDVPGAMANGIKLHNTQFWDANDQFGANTLNPLINQVQPHVVITLGDPWMTDHVQRCEHRHNFTWLAYVPIDRDVLRRSWRHSMKQPDVLVCFSQFGKDIVEEQIPFRNPRLILHGVDRKVFKPFYPPGMDENTPYEEVAAQRKAMTFGEQFRDKFIVGWVGRNQVRKAMPTTVRAFKAFNCATWIERQDVIYPDGDGKTTCNAQEFCHNKQKFRCDICPAFQQREEAKETTLYLHTSPGESPDGQDRQGVGWLVAEIIERNQLKGRVAITPNLNVVKGVPRAHLAQIMNCFDVHCFLTHSEGFGLPAAESVACGVPTLVTDYTSLPEIVSKGGGSPIDVKAFFTFVTFENELAIADVGEAADKMNEIFEDPALAEKMRKEAAASNYVPDWDEVAMQFRNLILESQCQAPS